MRGEAASCDRSQVFPHPAHPQLSTPRFQLLARVWDLTLLRDNQPA
jgi:hypothetical protein